VDVGPLPVVTVAFTKAANSVVMPSECRDDRERHVTYLVDLQQEARRGTPKESKRRP